MINNLCKHENLKWSFHIRYTNEKIGSEIISCASCQQIIWCIIYYFERNLDVKIHHAYVGFLESCSAREELVYTRKIKTLRKTALKKFSSFIGNLTRVEYQAILKYLKAPYRLNFNDEDLPWLARIMVSNIDYEY